MPCCDRIDDIGEITFCRWSIRNSERFVAIVDASSVQDMSIRIDHDNRRNDRCADSAGELLR